jgi:glycosyltransferase involved in cell wall biosynthesis
MASIKGRKSNNSQGRKIIWAGFLILDKDLHKTSQLEILRNLAKLNYNARLIAMHSNNKIQDENALVQITSIPLRYVPLLSPLIFAITLFFYLPFYIILSKPDYIITEPDISVFGLASVLPFSKLKRIRLILDIRSTPVEIDSFRGKLRALCFNISVLMARKLFDGITIITTLMKEEVCKKFNINPNFIGVWTSGVSITLFNPKLYVSEREKLRKELGLSNKFVIFYHGTFSANRGLTETIEAMSIIKNDHYDIVLFLLGTGPIINALKDLVHVKGLQNNVIISDPVKYEDVPKYIAMSDVCIVPLPNHPYWRFQCPLKLLEYLAMEKVVILTDIPAHRAVINDAECGIYISSVNPTRIAEAIRYVHFNMDSLKEWGKIGREIVKREYVWEKVAKNLVAYLSSID